jgi:membrane protease YdiL (CAAX protease family)
VAFLEELRLNLVAWLLLAAGSFPLVAALWFWFVRGRPLLPPQRERAVPWGGFEVGLIVFLVFLLWPGIILEALNGVGFFAWIYGPGFEAPADAAARELANVRRLLWVVAVAFPFQTATIPVVLHFTSGTRPYQLGLTLQGAARGLAAGWLAWLVLTPPVTAFHLLLTWINQAVLGFPPEEHAVGRLAEQTVLPAEWAIVLGSALIAAPVLEELFFRGFLQPFFISRWWGDIGALTVAFALAFLARADRIHDAWILGDTRDLVYNLGPAVFVVLLVPGLFLLSRLSVGWLPDPWVLRMIYGTAAVFGMAHANVWPTPIPLFILGLGLGFLAYRTQSLVASFTLHCLFNGVACVVLLLQ